MGRVERRANAPGDPAPPSERCDRTLDVQVAVRADGYRWVEWKHEALGGAPLDEPGRFLGAPTDPLVHLQKGAEPGAPLAAAPYRNLRHYATDRAAALAVAEKVGLFGTGAASLSRDRSGRWHLAAARGIALDDACLARLICLAVLAYVDASAADAG